MASGEFIGKRVVVMGLGHFGGGIGVTRWLVSQGADVLVTDRADEPKLAGALKQLDGLRVRYRLGGHDETDLDGCDLLVVSPAVPKDRSDFVQAAESRQIALSSEMNLFLERCPIRRVVGITGSAGKSTTTAMLGAILEQAAADGVFRKAWVGGNIGKSLLGDLDDMHADDVLVLELSSFQLEDTARIQWSPPFAVVTNIRPNHLDRHGTLEAYTDAKMNLVRYQSQSGRVFLNAQDLELLERVGMAVSPGKISRFAFDDRFINDLRVPGEHNRINAAAAIAVARALGVNDACISAGLQAFHGLSHRLEFIAERNGVRYYNDSKSTTPESTRIAVDAFEQPLIVLIGGRDKGMSFDELCTHLSRRAKAVICYGEVGPTLAKEIDACNVLVAETLQDATRISMTEASAGDVVVLSPACTSYDQFSNYEERGDAFRHVVLESNSPLVRPST